MTLFPDLRVDGFNFVLRESMLRFIEEKTDFVANEDLY